MRQIDPRINELAIKVCDRINHNDRRFTLFLGAGASIPSGISSYWTLCKEYCNRMKISVRNGDYINAFKNSMSEHPNDHVDTRIWFEQNMLNRNPSIGYYHLANLIKLGAFKTIFTTNFDNLLEVSLSKIMSIDKFKVLVRQKEQTLDKYISEILKLDDDSRLNSNIKIIKLHGDIQSDIFLFDDKEMEEYDTDLTKEIKSKMSGGCVIVGSELDDHCSKSIFRENNYYIYVNKKDKEDIKKELLSSLKVTDSSLICGQGGDFDLFFTELDLAVQGMLIQQKEKKLIDIKKDIITKEGRGVGYINDDRLEIAIGNLYRRIEDEYVMSFPDVIFFINDPQAPGGIDIMKRMKNKIQINYPNTSIHVINIEGDKENGRYIGRHVTSAKPQLNINLDTKILVLDSISFSGNTMKVALKQLRDKHWFPNCDIKGGILYIGLQLKDKIEKLNSNTCIGTQKDDILLKGLIYHKKNVTDRHEIFFPWGITQATDECKRIMMGIENDHIIRVTNKPWGIIERFTEQEYSSVRILTIEANQKLSFQRHLVRDEFFVALDENVGLEICEKSLDCYLDLDNNVISERLLNEVDVKSLILEKGDCILIPRGFWHRFKASKARVRLLEIAYGVYDERNDIVRLIDDYGREDKDGLD